MIRRNKDESLFKIPLFESGLLCPKCNHLNRYHLKAINGEKAMATPLTTNSQPFWSAYCHWDKKCSCERTLDRDPESMKNNKKAIGETVLMKMYGIGWDSIIYEPLRI